MSLYGDYIKERKGYGIIEDEHGFATYGTMDVDGEKAMYIEEIFVRPEFRQNKIASKYADEIALIAKNNGIKKLIGSVCTATNNAHQSLLVLLGYGFKLYSNDHDTIYFIKDI